MEKYRVDEKLGEGCFGSVVAATLKATNTPVALKRIPITRLREGLPQAVIREMLSLREVTECSNIVKLYEVFPAGSALILALERCGTDVGAVLKRFSARKRLSLSSAKSWMRMALCALAYCHKRNILHRDIKPSNLLLSADGTLKLGDFGLARHRSLDGGDMTHEVATRWYRAPELLLGARKYDGCIDIWGLGCVFGELLSGCGGSVLFPGDGDIDQMNKIFRFTGTPNPRVWPGIVDLPDWNKIVFKEVEGIGFAALFPSASPAAIDLLTRMLSLDPSKRITAEEALEHKFFSERPNDQVLPLASLPPPEAKLPSISDMLQEGGCKKVDFSTTADLNDSLLLLPFVKK